MKIDDYIIIENWIIVWNIVFSSLIELQKPQAAVVAALFIQLLLFFKVWKNHLRTNARKLRLIFIISVNQLDFDRKARIGNFPYQLACILYVYTRTMDSRDLIHLVSDKEKNPLKLITIIILVIVNYYRYCYKVTSQRQARVTCKGDLLSPVWRHHFHSLQSRTFHSWAMKIIVKKQASVIDRNWLQLHLNIIYVWLYQLWRV